MATFTFNSLQHQQFFSITSSSVSNSLDAKICNKEHKCATKAVDSTIEKEMGSGFSPLRSRQERVERKPEFFSVVEETMERKYRKDSYRRKDIESRRKREMGYGISSLRSADEKEEIKAKKTKVSSVTSVTDGKIRKCFKKNRGSSEIGGEKLDKRSNKSKSESKVGEKKIDDTSKKKKLDLVEVQFRIELDMCSKRGDFLAAISLYDSAQRKGNIKLGQYHYTVLLYLCSSAAVGVVSPAKSGSLNKMKLSSEVSSANSKNLSNIRDSGIGNFNSRTDSPVSSNGLLIESTKNHDLSPEKMETNSNGSLVEFVKHGDEGSLNQKELEESLNFQRENIDPKFSNGFVKGREGRSDKKDCEIRVTGDIKRFALMKGFEIYEKMCREKIPLNEAALTSVARMAMSMSDGDMAFEMVKKIKELGINPRLRSYGPALFTFCNNGEIEKAFKVEEHMLENGVYPEEPELEALLKVSVENGNGDKVYHILHKLRTSVRQVSVSTADLIERWFESKAASRVGKRKWVQRLIMEAIENGGGGWHGQGWLGKGKWTVTRTSVATDGVCEGCGEKLVTIDLDPLETENFAKSVACIALKREKNSSFQKFQKWLDYYGPFEAVVDAANVGLFTQRRFSLSKVNAIVNGIRQKLPSKKWPLIVVHNKRISGDRMEEPANKTLIEKWKNADALFPTPTGSNDDWYWLYAAIKFKCLIVTNDEMRDHIFQLLGNDFFPRWKERHQVHFNFGDGGPEFYMPPPCSVVIQESEKGHWHIPIASETDSERERTWLCVTRIHMENQDSHRSHKEAHLPNDSKSNSQTKRKIKQPQSSDHHGNGSKIHQNVELPPQETYRNLRNILSTSVFSNYRTLISDIEDAEKLAGCTLDFQI
ncbi:Pentatricopeptide repeat [Macleaya cordata]|uniref:ribonuclease P n=1 Tax=Macleaya cordata TaxID=56857 RepID=A0A200RC90_MACCD|nr:Pentatricopeptide repeat [Macleaya cordata]